MIPSSNVRLLVAGLSALGVAPASTATRIGASEEQLRPQGEVTVSQALKLLNFALEIGGPDFGVRAGFALPSGSLGLVDHLCAAAPTWAHALEDLARYFGLVATGVKIDLQGSAVILDMPAFLGPEHRRLLGEMTFAILDQRLGARLPGGVSGPSVDFPWPPPADRERLDQRWPNARYERPQCLIRWEPELLATPLVGTNPSLHQLLDGYATEELAQMRPVAKETSTGQVERCIIDVLPRPAPTALEVARRLGMSPRSLRRALRDEGTTFSKVRDAHLRRVAEQALRDPSRTIAEVGWLLGYSEVSAFHRAFRRWTGSTPAAYREAGRVSP